LTQPLQHIQHALVCRDSPPRKTQTQHQTNESLAFASRKSARFGKANQQMQGGRHARRSQTQAVTAHQLHPLAPENLLGINANTPHEGERFAIGTDQQMLPIIERDRAEAEVDVYPSRASAQLRGGFNQGGLKARSL
jgi:hypothetical protein